MRQVRLLCGDAEATVCITDSTDGDLNPEMGSSALSSRRGRIAEGQWMALRQVHHAAVLDVDEGCAAADRPVGDGWVAAGNKPSKVLAIHTADCAAVGLLGDDGTIAAVHAGWRGALGGIIGVAVETMRERGSGQVSALVGPHIKAGCYEFGPTEIAPLVERFGPKVRSATRQGRLALDLTAVVQSALREARVDSVEIDERCTNCEPDLFSHRSGDAQRQALAIFRS